MDESVIKKEPLGNGFFINVSKHHTFGTDAVLLADFANAKKTLGNNTPKLIMSHHGVCWIEILPKLGLNQ